MKKMNRKFLTGTAFAVGAAAALSGCGMPQAGVYGPAPTAQVETMQEATSEAQVETIQETTSAEQVETVQVPTPEEQSDTFVPETEVQEDVYGPPEFFN